MATLKIDAPSGGSVSLVATDTASTKLKYNPSTGALTASSIIIAP